jgi:hypothetical protein
MSIWSSIWNGFGDFFTYIADKIFEGVFWLVDKVFDIIEALDELLDEFIEWLDGLENETGEEIVLPPNQEVINIVQKMEEEGKVVEGTTAKVRRKNATVTALKDGNQLAAIRVGGSEMGFDKTLTNCINSGKMYKRKLKTT